MIKFWANTETEASYANLQNSTIVGMLGHKSESMCYQLY